MKISMPLLRMACDSLPCLQAEHSLNALPRCTRHAVFLAPRASSCRALHLGYELFCRVRPTLQQEAALSSRIHASRAWTHSRVKLAWARSQGEIL